ncbi:hypothetical protein NC651_010610 [Populus alba x Populus x berolinensis]|nr:hypothetical protein NC651_010610 [Populus alba x Populus x berolinensis]
MEELGLHPSVWIVNMVGSVFQRLGMTDKNEKLKKNNTHHQNGFTDASEGKRVRIRAKPATECGGVNSFARGEEETSRDDEVDVVKDVANEDEEASCDVKVVGSSFLQARILRVAMM